MNYYLQAYNNVHSNRICSVHEALQVCLQKLILNLSKKKKYLIERSLIEIFLQTLSWIMTLSWIVSLFILILRLIVLNDFHLRKTIVYKVSVEKNIQGIEEELINGAESKLSRIRQFFNRIFRNQAN